MSDGKIYITISNERSGGSNPVIPSPSRERTESAERKISFESYLGHKTLDVLKNQAQQIIQAGINNIGNFTGDYLLQRNVNTAVSMGRALLNVGAGAYMGARIGGGIGAVVGTLTELTLMGTNFMIEQITATKQNQRTNYEIARLKQLSGLNTKYDGSRGTFD